MNFYRNLVLLLLLLLFLTQGIADAELSRDLQPVPFIECFHSPS